MELDDERVMAGFTRGDVLGIFSNMREVLLDVFVEMLRQLLSNKLPISMRSHVLALLLLVLQKITNAGGTATA